MRRGIIAPLPLAGHVHEWPMRSSGENDGTDPALAFLLCGKCHLAGCHGWPRLVPRYLSKRLAYGRIAFAWVTSKVAQRVAPIGERP